MVVNSAENLAFWWQIQCFLTDCFSFIEHNEVYGLWAGFSRLFLSAFGAVGLWVGLM